MRQVAHIAIAIAFWVALVVLWVVIAVEGKASASAFRDTGLQLGALIGAVLAITTLWVRHNVAIYRKKGPRLGRAEMAPRVDEDRLGHELRWDLDGEAAAAAHAQVLIVELDGNVKTYRRAG